MPKPLSTMPYVACFCVGALLANALPSDRGGKPPHNPRCAKFIAMQAQCIDHAGPIHALIVTETTSTLNNIP